MMINAWLNSPFVQKYYVLGYPPYYIIYSYSFGGVNLQKNIVCEFGAVKFSDVICCSTSNNSRNTMPWYFWAVKCSDTPNDYLFEFIGLSHNILLGEL